MNGREYRPPVAVDAGADGTRLVVPGPDGWPETVAVLPAGTGVVAALDALVGTRPVAALAVVHRASAAPDRYGVPDGRAAVVRAVPVPLAVLAVLPVPNTPTGLTGPVGTRTEESRLVVDAGRSGTDVAVVAGDRVTVAERVPVGGDHLDASVARAIARPVAVARAVREALSFRETVPLPGAGPGSAGGTVLATDQVDDVLRPSLVEVADRVARLADRAGPVEVVLTGGTARTPLLAALLDDRLRCPVRVLPEPDRAAVLGALALVTCDDDPAARDRGGAPAAGEIVVPSRSVD